MDSRVIRKSNNRNYGFTLVEMIVVLVLLMILITLSIGGLFAWQDWSRFKQENTSAELIFYAAQNQLNDLKYFKQVEPILQEVVINKLAEEKNLYIAVNPENNEVVVNNKSVYVLITDFYKYSAHHRYRKIENIDEIKGLIKECNPERLIITDGPRYMGIIPVDKFLLTI